MEIPKTRRKLDTRAHCEFVQDGDCWTCTLPILEISASAPTEDEAYRAMAEAANAKLAGDEALQARWHEWAEANAVEEPIPEKERSAMQATIDRSKEASKAFPALTADGFDDAIASDVPVLVDFWADWCMPCHQLAPVLADVARTLDGRMTVAKLNSDEHHSVSERFGVKGLPTMVLFRGGKELHRLVGAGRSKDEILGELEPHL